MNKAADLEEADCMAIPDQSTISFVADRVLPDGKKKPLLLLVSGLCLRQVKILG